MTPINISMHNVTSAKAEAKIVGDTRWIDFTFSDREGQQMIVAVFTEKPHAMINALSTQTFGTAATA